MDDSNSLIKPPAMARVPLSNTNFNLIQAIFVPFYGLPGNEERPKDRDQKLKLILQDLDKHHDEVRRNMIFLVNLQKEKLLSDAKDALAMYEGLNGSSNVRLDNSCDAVDAQDIDDVIDCLKTSATPGIDLKEYEFDESDITILDPRRVTGAVDADGDAHMTGVNHEEIHPTKIRQELATALQELVLRAKSEMENYDTHATVTKQYYQRALERSAARQGYITDTASVLDRIEGVPGTTEGMAGGILNSKNEEIRVDNAPSSRTTEKTKSPLDRQHTNTIGSSRDPWKR